MGAPSVISLGFAVHQELLMGCTYHSSNVRPDEHLEVHFLVRGSSQEWEEGSA